MPLAEIVADDATKRQAVQNAIADLRMARREISAAIVHLAGHYSTEWANEIERLLDQAIRGLINETPTRKARP